jgi:hypothetical protein
MVDKYLFVQNVHHVGIIVNIRIESSNASHQLFVQNVGSCIKILEQTSTSCFEFSFLVLSFKLFSRTKKV